MIMVEKFGSELTFKQFLQILKRCWIKAVISVILALIISLAVVLTVYNANAEIYYSSVFTYSYVAGYYDEVENIRDPSVVENALLDMGYSEEYLAETNLVSIVSNHIYINAVSPENIDAEKEYKTPVISEVSMKALGIKGIGNIESKAILNAVLKTYTQKYQDTYATYNASISDDFDYLSEDYMVALAYLEQKFDSVYASAYKLASNTYQGINGLTFANVYNGLVEVSMLMEEYEIYVLNNTLYKVDADVTAYDFIPLYLTNPHASNFTQEAKLLWQKRWQKLGGTITNSNVYLPPEKLPAVDPTKLEKADAMLEDIQSKLLERITDYNELIREYNSEKVGTSVAYIHKPAYVVKESVLTVGYVVLIVIVCPVFALLAVLILTYIAMRREGYFPEHGHKAVEESVEKE